MGCWLFDQYIADSKPLVQTSSFSLKKWLSNFVRREIARKFGHESNSGIEGFRNLGIEGILSVLIN
jgi:hypothetical protein